MSVEWDGELVERVAASGNYGFSDNVARRIARIAQAEHVARLEAETAARAAIGQRNSREADLHSTHQRIDEGIAKILRLTNELFASRAERDRLAEKVERIRGELRYGFDYASAFLLVERIAAILSSDDD